MMHNRSAEWQLILQMKIDYLSPLSVILTVQTLNVEYTELLMAVNPGKKFYTRMKTPARRRWPSIPKIQILYMLTFGRDGKVHGKTEPGTVRKAGYSNPLMEEQPGRN